MDVRRRPPKPSSRSPPPPMEPYHHHHHQKPSSPELINDRSPSPTPKASYALHLPLYLTNAIFFTLIFSIAYYLLHRWRDKIRSSTPLHVLTLSELAAILSLIASFIYLFGFFGIGFVQSFISRSSNDAWEVDDHQQQQQRFIIDDEDSSRPGPCPAALDCATPKLMDSLTLTPLSTEEDEELVKSVVSGQIPSYSLESKLGDCHRAASIRREAVQRLTGRSLSGLPLDGFDYDSILGRKQD